MLQQKQYEKEQEYLLMEEHKQIEKKKKVIFELRQEFQMNRRNRKNLKF